MRSRQCSRPGVVGRDGRWYCKQHDPVAISERREEANRQYRRNMEVENAARERRAANELLGALVRRLPEVMIRDHPQGQHSRWACLEYVEQGCQFRASGWIVTTDRACYSKERDVPYDTPEAALREALGKE